MRVERVLAELISNKFTPHKALLNKACWSLKNVPSVADLRNKWQVSGIHAHYALGCGDGG